MSLLPAQDGHPPVSSHQGRPTDAVTATLPHNCPNFAGAPGNTYNSLPVSSHARPQDDRSDGSPYGATCFGNNGLADEFDSTRLEPNAVNVTNVLPPFTTPSNALPATSSNSAAAQRPDSAGEGNHFTFTNLQPYDNPQSTPTPSCQ